MSSSDFAVMEPWATQDKQPPLLDLGTPVSSVDSGDRKARDLSGIDRVVTCLLAEDNPISIKILEVRLLLFAPMLLS